MNALFQSDNIETTSLFEDLFLMFKSLLQRIVVPEQLQYIYITDNDLVNFDFTPYIINSSYLTFNIEFQTNAENLNSTESKNVKEHCRNFLRVLAKEIQSRLPENLATLKMMANLHPKVATSQVKPSLNEVLKNFSRTELYGDKDDIESEWNNLHNKSWSSLNSSVEFYSEVYDDNDAGGHKRFGNIAKFAMALLSVPISNASAERAFSTYNIVKNKLRNKLSIDLLQNVLMVRFSLLKKCGSCVNFNPTANMLTLFNYKMYDFKDVGQETQQEVDDLFEALHDSTI